MPPMTSRRPVDSSAREIGIDDALRGPADCGCLALWKRGVATLDIANRAKDVQADRIRRIIGLRLRPCGGKQSSGRNKCPGWKAHIKTPRAASSIKSRGRRADPALPHGLRSSLHGAILSLPAEQRFATQIGTRPDAECRQLRRMSILHNFVTHKARYRRNESALTPLQASFQLLTESSRSACSSKIKLR